VRRALDEFENPSLIAKILRLVWGEIRKAALAALVFNDAKASESMRVYKRAPGHHEKACRNWESWERRCSASGARRI
jgi:hypothetical protein